MKIGRHALAIFLASAIVSSCTETDAAGSKAVESSVAAAESTSGVVESSTSGQRPAGDPAILDGIRTLETFQGSELPGEEMTAVVVAEDVVDVEFNGGPICGPDRLAQEPGAVSVTYSEDAIEIDVDPMTRNCAGPADAAEFRFGVRLTLTEAIEDRPIQLAGALG